MRYASHFQGFFHKGFCVLEITEINDLQPLIILKVLSRWQHTPTYTNTHTHPMSILYLFNV